MATWYTSADADHPVVIDLWTDAAQLSPETMDMLLGIARDQVVAYAPPSTLSGVDGQPLYERIAMAQLRQAVNLYRASGVDTGGQNGDPGGFAVTPRPLDWHIKNLIRPPKGRPRVR